MLRLLAKQQLFLSTNPGRANSYLRAISLLYPQTRYAMRSSYLVRRGPNKMVRITCDMCGKVRPQSDKRIADDSWVLGYDIEIENANALQRSLRFLNRWDDARLLEIGSIHLCSEKCKDHYIKEARAAA
jgi:hypothetical protein